MVCQKSYKVINVYMGVRGGEQMERDKDGLASLDGVLRGVLLADDI